MTRAGLKWTALAVIAAGGVGAFAIYTLGWRNSKTDSDGQAEVEQAKAVQQAKAIGAVRLQWKQSCEVPWGEGVCYERQTATRFTAEDRGEGRWLVREHVRGHQPSQDTCWLVEPERLSRIAPGFVDAGLFPAPCECPHQSMGPKRALKGRQLPIPPEAARTLTALCPDLAADLYCPVPSMYPNGRPLRLTPEAARVLAAFCSSRSASSE